LNVLLVAATKMKIYRNALRNKVNSRADLLEPLAFDVITEIPPLRQDKKISNECWQEHFAMAHGTWNLEWKFGLAASRKNREENTLTRIQLAG